MSMRQQVVGYRHNPQARIGAGNHTFADHLRKCVYKDTEGDADLNHLLSIAYWHMLDKSYTQTEVRFVFWGRPEAVPHGD